MPKFAILILATLLFVAPLSASDSVETLNIELSDPDIRITIPGMPKLEMGVHPMNASTPNLRLQGSNGIVSVSVMTPNISDEVSPIGCATAVANTVLTQSVVTREQVFLGRSDEQTFLIIYGLPLEQSVLLNTHIVSSEGDKRCIEAHVSKVSTSDSDIEPWFNGFGESSIDQL